MNLKKITVLFLFLSLVIFSGCGNNSVEKEDTQDENILTELIQQQEIEMYQEVVGTIEEHTFSKYQTFLENTEYEAETYIYFGRPTCAVCREFVLSNDNFSEIENLVYIDTDKMTVPEKNELQNFNITEVPSILKISADGLPQKISLESFNEKNNLQIN
ncbi:hypothetical protein BBW79_12370 [Listeria monocytogenes]|nr:hypothetical protein [Listeria monocytogenes]